MSNVDATTNKGDKMDKVICDRCGEECVSNGFSTGYGTDEAGHRHCFACCAIVDLERMKTSDRETLYLTGDARKVDTLSVGNWPGTLKLPVRHVRVGRHNIARVRYDVYFFCQGREWHGVQYGDNTQIVHCRALKA